MIYGIIWILGGLFLHFQDRLGLPVTIHPWVVLVTLIILSGIIAYASNKSEKTATTTANASGGGNSSDDSTTASTPTTPASSSPTSWGGVVVGLVFAATLIGALFLWAPWSGNNFSPAISKADREMMNLGWQKIAVADVGGGYYSFEIPEGLTPGHKIKFQSVLWEKQRLSSGKEVDTCRGEWCTNYFFPAGVSVKDTPLYLKTKNPPRDFEWIKILPL